MTRINTNVSSLTAQKSLAQANVSLQQALTRLSTGLRINVGKDDPAGLIASEALRSDIVSTQRAIGNSERANQMIGTADSALPDYFITAEDVSPKAHVDIQAAAQKWIDSSISKTANVPTEFPFDDFKDIYMYAYDQGLKGCTTFRFNPEAFQGVLVKEQDLENTTYKFTLDDGSVVELKGNEEIEYDGEIHTAANLYDALKEGYYGKF